MLKMCQFRPSLHCIENYISKVNLPGHLGRVVESEDFSAVTLERGDARLEGHSI
jgi:hypothetical protein